MPQKDAEAYYFLDDDYYYSSADDDAFIGENLQFDFVKDIPKNKDGCICTKCKELFPFAEPNQPNGTMICYYCRNY